MTLDRQIHAGCWIERVVRYSVFRGLFEDRPAGGMWPLHSFLGILAIARGIIFASARWAAEFFTALLARFIVVLDEFFGG